MADWTDALPADWIGGQARMGLRIAIIICDRLLEDPADRLSAINGHEAIARLVNILSQIHGGEDA